MQEYRTEPERIPEENATVTELLDRYYTELHPEKRRQLLDELSASGNDALGALREALFQKRYQWTARFGEYADNYLYILIRILQEQNMPPGAISRLSDAISRMFRKTDAEAETYSLEQRRMLRLLQAFGKEEAEAYGEEGEADLHRELVNAVLRYFDTCRSPAYRRKLFGTMMPSDAERAMHIRKDAWDLSYGMAEVFRLQNESGFLCSAVSEAYGLFAPDDAPLSQGPATV